MQKDNAEQPDQKVDDEPEPESRQNEEAVGGENGEWTDNYLINEVITYKHDNRWTNIKHYFDHDSFLYRNKCFFYCFRLWATWCLNLLIKFL